MPGSADHKNQANHNEGLLHEELFRLPATRYCDWVVTISFYTGVHLVDKDLAEHYGRSDIETHDQRRDLISRFLARGGKNVWKWFETLYNDSRRARYDCVAMTQ